MKNNEISIISQPVGRVFSHTGRSFLLLLNKQLKSLDLKRNYYALLVIGNFKGEITQQELAECMSTDKVSIVRIVDYLSSKGYVNRIRSAVDRRKYSLTLTPKARRELPAIKNAMEEVSGIAFRGISKKYRDEFYSLLYKIKNNLNQSV